MHIRGCVYVVYFRFDTRYCNMAASVAIAELCTPGSSTFVSAAIVVVGAVVAVAVAFATTVRMYTV